ncbi:helix-turn-helix transcriptional regulator [Lentisalinibacter sediminis]|uniref:helix-turn-helix transcriptional regulator n=1 Tax=Lentisalinibacter sediminis TaxID=2992237 RepID=UPI003867EF70
MADKTIWRLPEVMARTGLSRSTIYAKISRNEFPPPINLSVRAVGWLADEVDAWIAGKIHTSRGDQQ